MDDLIRKVKGTQARICVVGTGYVGLPLVVEFARKGFSVTGFDLNKEKVNNLSKGIDVIGEFGNGILERVIREHDVSFTSNPETIRKADFILICVPTPIGEGKKPDLSFVEGAGKLVAGNMKKGSIVVLESTVYPGVTEDVLKPVLEKVSGMKAGKDFGLGYSPERVNPGDKEHNLRTVVKIVSGYDEKTAEAVEALYSTIVDAGVHKVRDIRTAEAAKVIENVQRDLNIALVNELSKIFQKMGLDTREVLDAAGTKWNFHKYSPGLVGGHCIPVDPYYLVHKSKELGYEPNVILAGRETNSSMSRYVAELALNALREAGKEPRDSRVLLLGLTFKRNVRDTRNAPAKGIIEVLMDSKASVLVHDPLIENDVISKEFGVESVDNLDSLSGIDCIITVTDHEVFLKEDLLCSLKEISSPGAVIIDARNIFSRNVAEEAGFTYRSL